MTRPRSNWEARERQRRNEARHRRKLARALKNGDRLSTTPRRRPEVCDAFLPETLEGKRHEHCASRRLCLNDAVVAWSDGRLPDGKTWCCADDCPGRQTVELPPIEFRRGNDTVIPHRVERWR